VPLRCFSLQLPHTQAAAAPAPLSQAAPSPAADALAAALVVAQAMRVGATTPLAGATTELGVGPSSVVAPTMLLLPGTRPTS
jgi:hypothetical protein